MMPNRTSVGQLIERFRRERWLMPSAPEGRLRKKASKELAKCRHENKEVAVTAWYALVNRAQLQTPLFAHSQN
jgi:hypothetical protein